MVLAQEKHIWVVVAAFSPLVGLILVRKEAGEENQGTLVMGCSEY
jgi:hypothetical protein